MSNTAPLFTSGNPDAYTPIHLGVGFDGAPAQLKLSEAMNFNVGLVGTSGSGKTTMLSHMIGEYVARGLTIVVLDTQGDQNGGNSGIDPAICNRTIFRYGSSEGQINPLAVSGSRDGGGPFAAIEDAIEIVRMNKPNLGDLQTGDLRWLLRGCLEHFGIYNHRPETWTQPGPTWTDFLKYTQEQLASLESNGGGWFFRDLRKCAKMLRSIEARDQYPPLPDRFRDLGLEGVTRPNGTKAYADEETIQAFMGVQSERLLAEAARNHGQPQRRRDPKRVAGLEITVANMVDSGLFGRDALSLKPGRVNIFDLSKINQTHTISLIHLLLKRMYGLAVRTCSELNSPVPSMMVVLDEAKMAVQTGKNVVSPINRIATEGRKYGMGMMVGVQHLGHLNSEIMSSLACKIVLPVDADKATETRKRLNISASDLKMLTPRSDGLIVINKNPAFPAHLLRRS